MVALSLTLGQGPKNQLGAAVTTGLPEERGHVAFHGATTQVERGGDGPISEPPEQECEHSSLRPADADRFLHDGLRVKNNRVGHTSHRTG